MTFKIKIHSSPFQSSNDDCQIYKWAKSNTWYFNASGIATVVWNPWFKATIEYETQRQSQVNHY